MKYDLNKEKIYSGFKVFGLIAIFEGVLFIFDIITKTFILRKKNKK